MQIAHQRSTRASHISGHVLLLLCLMLAGCTSSDSSSSSSSEVDQQHTNPSAAATEKLKQLFEARNVAAEIDGEWLVFADKAPMKARTFVTDVVGPDEYGWFSLTLNVEFSFAPGQRIDERYTGVGERIQDALEDGFDKFKYTAFGTIYDAFLSVDKVDRKNIWEINGVPHEVFGTRVRWSASQPVLNQKAMRWLYTLEQAIRNAEIPPGTHWVQLSVRPGPENTEIIYVEALLDNEPWPNLEAQIASLEWPDNDTDYGFIASVIVRDVKM